MPNTLCKQFMIGRYPEYGYWEMLYSDKTAYEQKKNEIAQQAMERVTAEYSFLEGNFS